MTKPLFELPLSSLSELEKIIEGYYVLDTNVSLDDISKLTGIGRTHLSPNHPFLKEVGIIQGTNQKSVTALGKDLGGSIHHKLADEIQQYWSQVVDGNEFLSKVVMAVKIKKGMTPTDLLSHILFVAKVEDNKSNRTGANAIIDILAKSKKIQDIEGKFEFAGTVSNSLANENKADKVDEQSRDEEVGQEKIQKLSRNEVTEKSGFPNLHINIQIHISADSAPEQIDQIFASMAKHLKGLGNLSNE